MEKIELLEEQVKQDFMDDPNKLEVAKGFMLCFKQFRIVVHGCFGVRELKPDYENDIQIFMATYQGLGLKVTPKIHILARHTSQFLKMFNEKWPLGHFSEQAMESCHQELKKELKAEAMVHVDHDMYAEKLKRIMVRVTGKHM